MFYKKLQNIEIQRKSGEKFIKGKVTIVMARKKKIVLRRENVAQVISVQN